MRRVYQWNGQRWAEVVPVVWEPIGPPRLDEFLSTAIRGQDHVRTILGVSAELIGFPHIRTRPMPLEGQPLQWSAAARRLVAMAAPSTATHETISALVSAQAPSPAGVTDSEQVSDAEWVAHVDALLAEVKDI